MTSEQEVLACECADPATEAREKVRAYLTYRERRLDPDFNPYARPHPELPWIERGLPVDAGALNTGHPVEFGYGHGSYPRENHFPVTPPPEPGARKVAVERPERIA